MVLDLNKGSLDEPVEPDNPSASKARWAGPAVPDRLERRQEARYSTHDPATVSVPYLKIAGLAAVVLDVSRSGLRLELPQAIGRGMQVEIKLSPQLVIRGEVRYCRRTGTVFHAGVLVGNAPFPVPASDVHLNDEEIGFYLVGKGLSVTEIIRVKAHLINCKSCQTRLSEADAILNPVRKRRI